MGPLAGRERYQDDGSAEVLNEKGEAVTKGTESIYDQVSGMEPATTEDRDKLVRLAQATRKEYEWQRKPGWPCWDQLTNREKRERVRATLLWTPKNEAPRFKQ